ncbi:MAG: glycosyltransferase family A protein [Turneriella sp.]
MISVLLPCHREGKLLARALRSVQEQTLHQWQLVLVCNNCDDETAAIAEASARADRRICLVTEPEPGIAPALNTGLRFCRGDYVARLDADDTMPADRLALQSAFLDQHSDVGLVSGQVRFVTDSGVGYDQYVQQINGWRDHETMYRYRFVESPVAHPSVMFRRELIDRLGGYSTENVPEDYELWLRWLTAGVRFAKVPETVLDWFDSTSRLSRTHNNYARAAFDSVRLRYLAQVLPQLSAGRPLWVCGGRYARRKARRLKQMGIAISGVVDIIARRLDTLKAMTYNELPAPGELFLVSFVSNRGAYRIIEDVLTSKGYAAERDFVLAA